MTKDMNIIPTAGVIIIELGRILLVRHENESNHLVGVYGWPGGRIQEGESTRHAAVRELEEETGLIAREEDLETFIHDLAPAQIQRKNGNIEMFSVELFVCPGYTGTLRATAETTPEWVVIKDIDTYSLLPNVKYIVETLSKIL
jgi:mutator protein MutT